MHLSKTLSVALNFKQTCCSSIQATAVYQAKEKLKSIEKARKGILVYIKYY